ncbi:MAG: Gfo/Idh/MocA family oxidoreductase [Isosphaeraceae bacterium]
MNPLRVGVVGVGHLGQHHARILATLPGVELVGVADADPDRAAAIAAKCETAAVRDYRQLLDAVDAVTVAVPTVMHREVAGAFLARGIATMVEKPMAGTLAEAEQLATLARVNRAVLQVGHIERFNPALTALNQLPIRPKYITAERLSTYTFRSTDIGVVFDLMIHDLDLLLSMIAAPVRSVAAVGLSLFGEHEDVANARIEFEDGSVANVTASRASYTPLRKMRIWGAEGYASLDFAARRATLIRPSEQLRRGRLDLDGVDLSKPSSIKDHLFGKVLRVDEVACESVEPLALELQDFVAAARGEVRPRVGGEDALRAIRLADQVLRSLESHRWDGEAATAVMPPPPSEAVTTLQGPHAWRIKSLRNAANIAGH